MEKKTLLVDDEPGILKTFSGRSKSRARIRR